MIKSLSIRNGITTTTITGGNITLPGATGTFPELTIGMKDLSTLYSELETFMSYLLTGSGGNRTLGGSTYNLPAYSDGFIRRINNITPNARGRFAILSSGTVDVGQVVEDNEHKIELTDYSMPGPDCTDYDDVFACQWAIYHAISDLFITNLGGALALPDEVDAPLSDADYRTFKQYQALVATWNNQVAESQYLLILTPVSNTRFTCTVAFLKMICNNSMPGSPSIALAVSVYKTDSTLAPGTKPTSAALAAWDGVVPTGTAYAATTGMLPAQGMVYDLQQEGALTLNTATVVKGTEAHPLFYAAIGIGGTCNAGNYFYVTYVIDVVDTTGTTPVSYGINAKSYTYNMAPAAQWITEADLVMRLNIDPKV